MWLSYYFKFLSLWFNLLSMKKWIIVGNLKIWSFRKLAFLVFIVTKLNWTGSLKIRLILAAGKYKSRWLKSILSGCARLRIFLIDVLFVYISNVMPLLHFPSMIPPSHPHPLCLSESTSPPTHSFLTILASPFSEASSLHKTKHPPSSWCQMKQSSATYLAGAMVLVICIRSWDPLVSLVSGTF